MNDKILISEEQLKVILARLETLKEEAKGNLHPDVQLLRQLLGQLQRAQ